jgi:hypothetical protein
MWKWKMYKGFERIALKEEATWNMYYMCMEIILNQVLGKM